jgi:uncharacterized protein involved in exopolysaccharide biosynthesis
MTPAPSSLRGKTVLALLAAGILAGGPLQAAETAAPAAKTYTAVAVLLVERQEPSIVPRGGETIDPGEFETFRATQMQLIKSRWVILAALRDSKIKDLPVIRRADATHVAVRMLANAIRVQAPDRHSGVVTVSITTYDPAEAAALVNAIVGAYMHEVVQAAGKPKRLAASSPCRRSEQSRPGARVARLIAAWTRAPFCEPSRERLAP